MEKSDRISSAFIVFVPNKSLIIALIRFFGLRFFSLPAKGRDKIVWSVRFRRARRTSVRRAAKSGAEKAKTFNFMQESVRIPTPYLTYGTYYRLIIIVRFRFFVPDDFSLPESFFGLRFFINRQIALSAHLPPSSSRNFHRKEAIYPLRRRLYQTASASYIQFSSRRTPAKPP